MAWRTLAEASGIIELSLGTDCREPGLQAERQHEVQHAASRKESCGGTRMPLVTREQIMERVTAIVAEVVNIDDLRLTDQSTARDVQGWDSLTHVQIIIAVENEYGFQFSFSEAAQLENVGQFLDAIHAKAEGA